jgi:V/A-type H+-transporting ATPase subunit E
MDNLETGKDKIKKICEILKNETLEPAKLEAQKIIENAQEEAHRIIKEAEKTSADMIEKTKGKLEKERELFQGSLSQAAKQSVIALRQDIEDSLFNKEVVSLVDKMALDPNIVSQLVTTLVKAVEKEGTSTDFSAQIAATLPPEKINALLTKQIIEKLREKSVTVGQFVGGIQLKLHDRNLTLDLSDKALTELLGKYLRKDFRKVFFGT